MFKRVILSLIILAACAETKRVIIQGDTGAAGLNGTNGVNGANGIDGTNGVDGINGVSCFITESTIVCGESSFDLSQLAGPIGPQGEQGIQGIPGLNGQDGQNGQSCIVVAIEGGAQILCGDESSVVLHDGVNGQNGEDGIDGTNGTNGQNGSDGSSCSVSEVEAGALITCTDGTSVLIPFEVGNESDGKVAVCHKPGTPAEQTLYISPSAVPAHLAQGGYLGPCNQ
jgi:hypothetical protein